MIIIYHKRDLDLSKVSEEGAYSMGWESWFRGENPAENPFSRQNQDLLFHEWSAGYYDCQENFGKALFGSKLNYYKTCPVCACDIDEKSNCPNHCDWINKEDIQ